MKPRIDVFLCVLLALGAVLFHSATAAAGTVYALVSITNQTDQCFAIPAAAASKDGTWTTQSRSAGELWASDGSPPRDLGPGQTIYFESASPDGGVAAGTGGQVTIQGVGTMSWSAPWGNFNGAWPGQTCSGNRWGVPADQDKTADSGGGFVSFGYDPAVCVFHFDLTASPSKTPCVPPNPGMIVAGEALAAGTPYDAIRSADGRYSLTMQTDGNLVLYDFGVYPPQAVWASDTWGTSGSIAKMQDDGNFVVYDTDGTALWASSWYADSDLQPGSHLALFSGAVGDAVVFGPGGGWPIWASNWSLFDLNVDPTIAVGHSWL